MHGKKNQHGVFEQIVVKRTQKLSDEKREKFAVKK